MTAAVIALIICAGIIFIAIELFLVPGFSVPGLVGIAMIGYGVYKAHIEYGMAGMLLSVVISIAAAAILVRLSLKSRIAKKIGLDYNVGDAHANDDYSTLLGCNGVTLTALRPAGIALIDGKRSDVVTVGDYIGKDIEIEVIEVEGSRIVVGPKKTGVGKES